MQKKEAKADTKDSLHKGEETLHSWSSFRSAAPKNGTRQGSTFTGFSLFSQVDCLISFGHFKYLLCVFEHQAGSFILGTSHAPDSGESQIYSKPLTLPPKMYLS